jgi:thiol-disulfide isomerase/thioredoxin
VLKRLLFAALFLGVLPAFAELPPGSWAPEFPKDAIWLGVRGSAPTMKGLRGKVVIVDFWEYTCINCIRTFPHLKEWYQRYHSAGLEVIGVHKGEFQFASDPENVRRAYDRFQLPYPSIVDVRDVVWRAYDSNSWPNSFLIDRRGLIHEVHQGEGNYGSFEREIQRPLQEGHRELDFSKFVIQPDAPLSGPACGPQSPEI